MDPLALAPLLAQYGYQAGAGFARAQEQKKKEGQLAAALRRTLSIAYPERKGEWDTLGLSDLQGAMQGEALRQTIQNNAEQASQRQAQMQYLGLQGDVIRQQLAQHQANLDFNANLSMANPQDMAGIADAAQLSGYALPPERLAGLAETVQRLNQPKFTPGVMSQVPGAEDWMFGVQSPNGAGSFFPRTPTALAAKPLTEYQLKQMEKMDSDIALNKAKLAGNDLSEIPPETAQKMRELQRDIDSDEMEVAKGNRRWGPDWNPLAERFSDRIAANKAALAVLRNKYPATVTAIQRPNEPNADFAKRATSTGTAIPRPAGFTDAQLIAEAQSAIAKGANPEALKAQLKAWGVNVK